MVAAADAPKVKWKVEPEPSGRFRSFQHRGWPMAYYQQGDSAVAIMLTCETSYSPSKVRSGEHEPIYVHIAQWNITTTDGRPTFRWRRLKRSAETLEQAKQMGLRTLHAHPDFWFKE